MLRRAFARASVASRVACHHRAHGTVAQPLGASDPITPLTHVSSVVVRSPGMAAVFQRLGIDFCCGGHIPIAKAAASKGLDGNTMAAMLDIFSMGRVSEGERVDHLTTQQLISHIVERHHKYINDEAPRIQAMANKVARVHADKDARVKDVAKAFRDLMDELVPHMKQEEEVAFPALLQLEKEGKTKVTDPKVFDMLLDEHRAAGRLLESLRALTDDFTPNDEWACGTVRSLWHGLREFEADLHNHIHKESNVLFPRFEGAVGKDALL